MLLQSKAIEENAKKAMSMLFKEYALSTGLLNQDLLKDPTFYAGWQNAKDVATKNDIRCGHHVTAACF